MDNRSPFLVKGLPVVTLPSHGEVGNQFNKVPKSPSGRPRDLKVPTIITRIPPGRKRRYGGRRG